MIRAVDGELIDERSGGVAEPVPSDLDALFRKEGDGVYRTLYAFTGGRAGVAEDATAEAFARAVAQHDVLRGPLAWIYRVAFRVAIDELRADRRRGTQVDIAMPPPEFQDAWMHGVLDNQTVRIIVRPSLTGSRIRIHLSNKFGMRPLTIRAQVLPLSDQRAEATRGPLARIGAVKEYS